MIDYRPISILFLWKEERISRITWNRATRPPSMHGARMVHANRNRACAIKKEAMQPIKKETAIIKDNTNHKRHVSMAHQSLLSSRLKRLKSGHRFGATIQRRLVGLPAYDPMLVIPPSGVAPHNGPHDASSLKMPLHARIAWSCLIICH